MQSATNQQDAAVWEARPLSFDAARALARTRAENGLRRSSGADFEAAALRLISRLHRWRAVETDSAIATALTVLGKGFAAQRVLFFAFTDSPERPGRVVQSWSASPSLLVRASSEIAAPPPLARAEALASGETLDLHGQPALKTRLEAGRAVRHPIRHPIGSAIPQAGFEVIDLPCVVFGREPSLLGVLRIEGRFEGQAAPDTAVACGLRVAESLAALLDRRRQDERNAASDRQIGALRSASHDLNNWLTAVLGYADILACELPVEGIWNEDLAELRAAAKAAAELAQSQLKPATTRSEKEAPRLDLETALGALRGKLAAVVGPSIEVDVRVPAAPLGASPGEGAPVVAFDQAMFERIALNLASNARDAIAEAGCASGRFRLELSRIEAAGGRAGWRLIVSDTGCGFSAAAQLHLFEEGWTSKGPGRGHGLGLSSIAAAMEQAGGSIRLHRSSSQGSVFYLDFPCADSACGTPI